jgi:predicted proteasome-type protease
LPGDAAPRGPGLRVGHPYERGRRQRRHVPQAAHVRARSAADDRDPIGRESRGQIGDEPPEILLVYPQGNYIRASDELPFLQIGEAKYGKFLLEMAVRFNVSAETAVKIALGSMMSTARANLSVGPPYDLAIYRNDAFRTDEFRIEADSRVLAELQATWERRLRESFAELPSFDIEGLAS